ncbi:hypothetical protein [Halarcobacter bivalviorum]
MAIRYITPVKIKKSYSTCGTNTCRID